MKRIEIYALYAAAACFALATTGCVRDDLPAAEGAQRNRDDRVIFGASISDTSPSTRASESGIYGQQKGEILTLSNQVFDMEDQNNGFPKYAVPVPFFVQHFYRTKASAEDKNFSDWTEEMGIYTDWTDVAGQLGFYTGKYTYGAHKDYFTDYPYLPETDNKEHKWHGDAYDAEHVFNAWTADFEMRHSSGSGGRTRWVTMDKIAGKRSSQYGTVRFFHFLRETNDPKRLKGGEDSLCVGTYDPWGSYDHTRPSLEHFIGLTGTIGTKEKPINYRSNAEKGGGSNVSMLFRHLVCQLHISKIHVTNVKGSEEFSTAERAIIIFPKMRRYAHFTTGNWETGEGPHIIDKDDEKAYRAAIEASGTTYDAVLKSTFSDNSEASPYKEGEYEAYTRNGGLGLAAYATSYLYLAPFDLETEGEFEVRIMKKGTDENGKTVYSETEVDAYYFGDLKELAGKLQEERIAQGRPAPEGKEKWLLAGEKLEFNLSLKDGNATGLDMHIGEWDEHGGSTGTGHAGSGDIYTEDDFYAVESLMDGRDEDREKLPPYFPDGRLEFHKDIDYDHHTDFHVPKDCVLDGMGNILHVIADQIWRRSGNQRDGKVGQIKNLFVVWEDTKNQGHMEYSYFNSEGKLIGWDQNGKGDYYNADADGNPCPFTSMEELLQFINENNLW